MNKILARVIRKVEQDYNIHIFSDKKYIEAIYLLAFGKKLNLKNPKTFNEKLQWLKLYDHDPKYTTMVDKFAVKDYVKKIIGSEYIIDTLGKWDSFDQIDFKQLPKQFVLKCTHDSGGLVICRDKEKLDKEKAKEKIEKSLKRNFYYVGREWPYKNVKPQIIAERYMEDNNGDLKDYNFFCFNGKVKFFKINFDRKKSHRANYYDCNGNLLSFGEKKCPPDLNREMEIHKNISRMIELAEALSQDIDFLRVDFYSLSDDDIKFGELTFYPASEFGELILDEEDLRIDDILKNSQGAALKVKCKVEHSLQDYKFYCFNGKPKLLYVSRGLENHETARRSFLTMDWENVPFSRYGYLDFDVIPERPEKFDEMKYLARKLSRGKDFLRVDLFQINGRVYFGELTFYPSSGFIRFYPDEYDRKLGDMLILHKK